MITRAQCLRNASFRPLSHPSLKGPRARWLHDYTSKYAEKLNKVAEDQGTSVDALRAKLQQEQLAKRRAAAAAAESELLASSNEPRNPSSSPRQARAHAKAQARKDSSPVKPLSTLFNLAKLLEKPHTPAQIAALWTAYHASRSGGTGRGYLCAAVPTATYEKMLECAAKYPSFVLPLPREVPDDEGQLAHEFHYLQWGLHGAPAVPSYEAETAIFPTATAPSPPAAHPPNPQTSTVLFTPLGEYKLRQAFATPYLALTFYADLARSHGVVLLRGEITPSAAASAAQDAADMRFLLSQADAQILAMGVQKFYLWGENGAAEGRARGKREELLQAFHEKPDEFRWEELLEEAKLSV